MLKIGKAMNVFCSGLFLNGQAISTILSKFAIRHRYDIPVKVRCGRGVGDGHQPNTE